MKVILADPAKEELENGTTYYELEQKGLGEIFEEEVKTGIKLITKYPYSWPEMREGIKKFILHKFPYKIIYSIEKDIILVLAIAHQHQKPDYWVDRIQDKKE
jgi:plasmid stabilization system protein ParE